MKANHWTNTIKAPVIVLAGAAHGQNVERYRNRWPRFQYLLFEPNTTYHPQLTRFAGDQRVIVTPKALSNKRGKATFYEADMARTSSLYPGNPADKWGEQISHKARQTVVETETLDLFCQEHNIPRIGFIELDAQGGELNALKGARGLLERKAVDCLMIEVFWAEVYKGAPKAPEVHQFMAEMGYISLGQTPQRPWADGIKRWGDVIYWRGQG